MDIRELKQLLKNSSSVLILDEGEPAFVILDYQVYRNLTGEQSLETGTARRSVGEFPAGRSFERPEPVATAQSSPSLSAQELEAIERLNKEILALKNQIEMEERNELSVNE